MRKYSCVEKHEKGGYEYCEECLKKQVEIDRLKTEMEHLKRQLRYRKARGEFSAIYGSSTPSSKLEMKSNSEEKKQAKIGGRPKGHIGAKRETFDEEKSDEVHVLRVEETECPDCGGKLESEGLEDRCVIDALLTKAYRLLYKCQVKSCKDCKKKLSRRPLVQPGFKYGNGLISNAMIMHYVEGVPLRRIAQIFGRDVSNGTLIGVFHYLAEKWKPIMDLLEGEYRASEVRHADETGWRTDGKNGYAWLFCTLNMSLFKFGKSRAAETPSMVMGTDPLGGVLIVDRYSGYNKMPCKIQYCYAHLLRDLQDIEKKFPKNKEVKRFVEAVAPLLARAMGLRREAISDEAYFKTAKEIQDQILANCRAPAKHLGIQTWQNLILDNEARLFHWVINRNVPAENNRAERELRPTVIARKNSFGSQSLEGAHTRSVLMSILHTAAKRLKTQTLRQWLLDRLDDLARKNGVDNLGFFPPIPSD